MKKNHYPMYLRLVLYVLVFLVALPAAALGQGIIPNEPEMLVISSILLFVLVLLLAFLLVRMVKKHNNRVAKKLQLLEDQFIRPECTEDALVEISGMISALKSAAAKGTRLWGAKRKQYEAVRITFNESLETFENTTNGLMDFLKTGNTEDNREISLETRLDEFSAEFYTFKEKIPNDLSKYYPGERGEKIKAGAAKIERIVNFILLDYRKYARVTAGMEKLNERFSSVLDGQEQYLTSRQQALAHSMKSLEDMMSKWSADALAAMQQELTARMDPRDEEMKTRTREMQEMRDMLRDSLKTSINNLDREVSKILRDQEHQLEERNKRNQEMIQEALKRVIDKLEIEYSTLGNKLDEKIGHKVDQLDNVLLSAPAKIEKPVSQALEKLKGNFALLHEQQTNLVEKQKEAAAYMQDETDTILGKFKTDFAAFLDQQKDMFEKQNNNLREMILEMQNSTDSYMEKFKNDFTALFESQSELLEKQKKVTDEMQNDADLNIEKFKKQFDGLLDQQQNLLKKQEDSRAKMQTEADAAMKKFKTDLSTLVENHNNNLKLYSDGIEHSISRLEKMQWLSDSTEKMKALINYINKNLYLNISVQDAHHVMERIEGEPEFSETYRKCAIALFDDLLMLEKSHKNQWYWRFLESIKNKLQDSIIPFYNRNGKTIYDSYFKEEVDLHGLRNVSEEQLRQIINKQHWGQIWEPLLCWTGFLKVYFSESLENLWTVLNYSAVNIVKVLEKSLGYRLDPFKPMQLLEQDLLEKGAIKESAEHVTFYREIVPQISDNDKLNSAQQRLDQHPDSKLIVFVDRLGLVDNGVRICESRLIFYSPVLMEEYE
ncbi:MAG: apolipoprotein A1/A4/E family protein [Candidatus Aminicenantes bacterium]|nr:MAG: apolipoprotein A1/A4/E family protein [Candidatus Aminicenantes bacterium]